MTCESPLQPKLKSAVTGQKFTELLLSKAKKATSNSHWTNSTYEIIYRMAAASKGRINEEAYSETFNIPIDRTKVGDHRGDFPNKTQAKLACIKSDGKFILNHLTEADETFVLTLVELEQITLLELSKDQLWNLNPTKQNGNGDYILVASKEDLIKAATT